MRRARVTGWGRATASVATVVAPSSTEELSQIITRAAADGSHVLARGLGRAYGDAAQNAGGVVVRLSGPPVVSPVADGGLVEVSATTSIGDLIDAVLPLGWFVPVTPGTAHVSIGGALAADVHGKNHHRHGSIGSHVISVRVMDGRGDVHDLARDDPAFGAVVGGMGLAGIILSARLRLRRVDSATMTVTARRTDCLAETMHVLAEDDAAHDYTVAWLDTLAGGRRLGRGVVTSGDHTDGSAERAFPSGTERAGGSGGRSRRSVTAPPWTPVGLLNRGTLAVFNETYYRTAPAQFRTQETSIGAFFHPLDAVSGWNRLYGRRGFLQYQVAVPGDEDLVRLVTLLHARGVPGFLGVLKRFGGANGLPLSFPIPGWTLALDIPAVAAFAPALDEADELVTLAGGRTYLAKDARTRPDVLAAMYPDLPRWRALRATLDPDRVFRSDLSRRLSL